MNKSRPVIGVVGPCAAGKTTLSNSLRELGYAAKPIAQEHSFAPTMWQRITNPSILIYLDVTYDVSMQRRKMNWNEAEFEEQHRRLAHAREHADFYLHTDPLTINEVLERTVDFLESHLSDS